jgi:hypothetical protein
MAIIYKDRNQANEERYPSPNYTDNNVSYITENIEQQEFIVSNSIDFRLERYPSPSYTNFVREETSAIKIPINFTINEYFDSILQTDVAALAVSASLVGELIITGSVIGGGWNDASASAAGVPVGGMYYTNTPTTGSIKVRLT